jgi:hypothetical protein
MCSLKRVSLQLHRCMFAVGGCPLESVWGVLARAGQARVSADVRTPCRGSGTGHGQILSVYYESMERNLLKPIYEKLLFIMNR